MDVESRVQQSSCPARLHRHLHRLSALLQPVAVGQGVRDHHVVDMELRVPLCGPKPLATATIAAIHVSTAAAAVRLAFAASIGLAVALAGAFTPRTVASALSGSVASAPATPALKPATVTSGSPSASQSADVGRPLCT